MINGVLDGRFRIEDVIAKGVSGGVFKGRDLRTDKVVAVKLMYTPPGSDARYGSRFRREAEILLHLAHPNIVQVLQSGSTADGVLYYAMEYVQGRTLQQLLQIKGRLDLGYALHILEQVAAALDAAHGQQVVHRDVCPSNIMLQGDEGHEQIKLIDFGIAKDLGETTTGGPATGRLRLGAAAYMAPEVLGGKTPTPTADIHALGVTLFEALTGQHPFKRETEIATIGAVLDDAPPALAAAGVSIPGRFEGILRQALAKAPKHRPPSAGAFVQRLRDALADAGVTALAAPPPPPRVAGNVFTGRNPAGNATTAARPAPLVRQPQGTAPQRHAAPMAGRPMLSAAAAGNQWTMPMVAAAVVGAVAFGLKFLIAP